MHALAVSLRHPTNLGRDLSGSLSGSPSEPLLRKAYRGFELCYGAHHHDTVKCMHSLATLLMEQGKHYESEHLLWREVGVCEEVYGLDHPTTLRACHCLGQVRGKGATLGPI